jgi:hypothetical protein
LAYLPSFFFSIFGNAQSIGKSILLGILNIIQVGPSWYWWEGVQNGRQYAVQKPSQPAIIRGQVMIN